MRGSFVSHTMARDGFCRGCDKTLKRGEQVAATYSIRNRGQSIYICYECCGDISDIYLSISFNGEKK